ncbi:MAG TPA: nucleotidyltransferase family protein, partial [Candidatus Binataceae bacterium]|nr:nucleotidyltransferase family protein [Candidatus Binataceae bacterium]
MKLPFHRDLRTQLECVLELAPRNPVIAQILRRAPQLALPHWYLGGGCIAQTVWNIADGFESTYGIRDYDLVYFDPSDLSWEGEDAIIRRARDLFDDLGAAIEVRNEARVHLWYARHFG